MSELTCGYCRNFDRIPLGAQGGGILIPKPGEAQGLCKAAPPQIVPLGGGNMVCMYPQLPEAFPVCALFVARGKALPGIRPSSSEAEPCPK